jgi:hypothetical protein
MMRSMRAAMTRLRLGPPELAQQWTETNGHSADAQEPRKRTATEEPPAAEPIDPLLTNGNAAGPAHAAVIEAPSEPDVEVPPVEDPYDHIPEAAITAAAAATTTAVPPPPVPVARTVRRQRVRPTLPLLRRRPRIRKVTRIVRGVDAWTVFKISLVFYVVLFIILLVAGVLLWNLANTTGTVAHVEGFIRDLFGLKTFKFDGAKMFRAAWVLGAILVIAGTGINVTLAVLFNLIADIVGGVRVTVLEEEVILRERPVLARPPEPQPDVDPEPPSAPIAYGPAEPAPDEEPWTELVWGLAPPRTRPEPVDGDGSPPSSV